MPKPKRPKPETRPINYPERRPEEEAAALPPGVLELERRMNEALAEMLPDINQVLEEEAEKAS